MPDGEWQQLRDEALSERRKRARTIKYRDADRAAEGPWQHRKGWNRRALWEDFLNCHIGFDWRYAAMGDDWQKRLPHFLTNVLDAAGLNGTSLSELRLRAHQPVPPPQPRPHAPYTPAWQQCDTSEGRVYLLGVKGDSELVVNWINGCTRCKNPRLLNIVHRTMNNLYDLWSDTALPAELGHDWIRHEYREGNMLADFLSKMAREQNITSTYTNSYVYPPGSSVPNPLRLKCSFDGSVEQRDAGSAWAIKVYYHGVWELWKAAVYYVPGASVATSELLAVSSLVQFLLGLVTQSHWRQVKDFSGGVVATELPEDLRAAGSRLD